MYGTTDDDGDGDGDGGGDGGGDDSLPEVGDLLVMASGHKRDTVLELIVIYFAAIQN